MERVIFDNPGDHKGFWAAFPKVELHIHLEGAIRFETLIDEYKRQGLPLPSEDTQELREYFLTDRPMGSLSNFLAHMGRAQKIFGCRTTITRITRECVLDRYNHGIRLLELRYSPESLTRHNGLSFETAHEAVKKGVREAQEILAPNTLAMGLICIAVGSEGLEMFAKVVDFAIAHKEDFIGFDIAGGEQDMHPYKPQMDRVNAAGFPITVHAGEDLHTGDPQHIADAINLLHARRIGHGVQIIHREDFIEEVIKKNILLEISPFSNVVTCAVESIEKHPVKGLFERGVSVSISTDDPGIMDIDLNEEYAMLCEKLNFSYDDFVAMNLKGLEHSFLSQKIKDQVFDLHFKNLRIKPGRISYL